MSANFESLTARIQAVLLEDRVENDLTSQTLGAFLNSDPVTEFEIVAKETLIFCAGDWTRAFVELGLFTLDHLDADGTRVSKGQQVLRGHAPLTKILSFERTLLNGMQRWSGVATLTKVCVQGADRAYDAWTDDERATWAKPKILHTRKTTPLWRDLEVRGVLAGGGHAHRLSLAERPMVKENHKEPAMVLGGGWGPYLEAVLKAHPSAVIEAETWEEARDAIHLGARALLLDNFSPQELRRHLVPFLKEFSELSEAPVIEVSGGISPSNLEDYVLPGVARISMGALTHSYRSVDLSLNILLPDDAASEGAYHAD